MDYRDDCKQAYEFWKSGYPRDVQDGEMVVHHLEAEIERLQAWLKDARHKQHCMKLDYHDERADECTCGLDALREEDT